MTSFYKGNVWCGDILQGDVAVRPIGRGKSAMLMAGQMHLPLSSSQSPLSSVSLAVTSSAFLVPAMLARTRSLRYSGSPHHAGRGGAPMRKLRPLPCSSSPHRAERGGGPFRSCQKRNGPYPQGVRRIRKRQSRQRLRSRYALPGRAWRRTPHRTKSLPRSRRGRCPHRPVAEAPSTTRPAAAKREAVPCDDHPDEVGTIRHGTAATNSQKSIACPKIRPNRRLHRYADPRTATLHACAKLRPERLFLLHRARRVLFLGKTKKRTGGALPSWQSS